MLTRWCLVPGGHAFGDGSGRNNAKCWDDRVHDAEIDRDNYDDSCGYFDFDYSYYTMDCEHTCQNSFQYNIYDY